MNDVDFNKELEETILGNCLLETNVFTKLLDRGIVQEDFYLTKHQRLFEVLMESYSTKNSTSLVLVFPLIQNDKYLTITYLSSLYSNLISFSDINIFIDELLRLKINREFKKIAVDIQKGAIKSQEDVEERFNKINDIKSMIGDDNTLTSLDKVEIVDIHKAEKIPTGFKAIDDKILGFVMGSLNIITGYAGNGKSTLVNQMCIAESLRLGYKIFAYSPELTNSNFKAWLYPTIANSDHFVEKEFKGKKYKTIGELGIKYIDDWIKDKLLIYTDDSVSNDNKRLLLQMDRLAKNGVKVFILDNLMTIDLEENSKNELIEQKRFVNKLKQFSRKYNVIVHLVAHARKPQNGNTKISLFDVNGSSNITNLADYVVSITRITEDEKNKHTELQDKDASIKFLKERLLGNNGLVQTFQYDKDRHRFYSTQKELNRNYGYDDNKELVKVEKFNI